ncbi:MAG TPA: NifU family protein [Fimbriiglobus sp.]|jgi:Fe-S cluster biogenesis protein NfuA|nr:NifU family protein [Fimbriiglobus sp.]
MPDHALTDRVAHALRIHAAPSLGLAASDVELVAVADGIASVRLGGACVACGMSVPTILTGLEQELRRHVPEVELLEAVP